MSRPTCSVICKAVLFLSALSILSLRTVPAASATDTPVVIAPQSVLIFENQARDQKSHLIIRVARYRPDIVFEWENVNDQGTVHLYRSAVSKGPGFTVSTLFEVGVAGESEDAATLWLPLSVHAALIEKGSVKLKRNQLSLKLKKKGEGLFPVKVGKRETALPVIHAVDDRGNRWTIAADPENPLLVAYESKYFKQRLITILPASGKPTLRWIKKLPPVR